MRFTRAVLAALVVLGLLLPTATPRAGAAAPGRIARLDAFIAQALAQYRVPGASVAVVEDGKIVLLKGYGVRDVASGAKVDPATQFQLASVSKTFTGVAAGMLVDEKRLAWDTPIVTYLPEFVAYDPYVTRHMTMRDLLAHRTGWPKFTGDILNDFGYGRADVVRRLRYVKPKYSFRDVAQYSNFGYFLAGEVTARVAGMPWRRFVRERIFAPLGMTDSSVTLAGLHGNDVAKPYALVDGALRLTTRSNSDLMASAGGVNSTAADLAHYLQFFLGDGSYGGKRLLQRQTLADIFARSMVSEIDFTEMPPISDETGYYYGLGVASYDDDGHRVIEKGGALSGFRTVVAMIPDKRAGIVVLSNLNVSAFPEAVRAYYLDTLLGKNANADLTEIAARNAKLTALFKPIAPPANARPFRGSTTGLEGTYENPLYGQCTIAFGNAPSLRCGPARYTAPLLPFDGNTFLAKWPGATSLGDEIEFKVGSDGRATSFVDDALGTFTRVR